MVVRNAYGVRYPDGHDEHPTYTIDAELACGAAKYGGTHTCSCVYRETACDELNHLCMCGDSWEDARACYCKTISTPREKKETPMPETLPVKVTTIVEWGGRKQVHVSAIQQIVPADEVSSFAAVRAMLRDVAVTAAEAFPAAKNDLTDDLFAKQKYQPKRTCCTKPVNHDDDCDGVDGYDSFGMD